MDSFEARLQFIQVIKSLYKTLNMSKDATPSTQKETGKVDPVQFYLLHFEHHYEDFHSCLLEITESMDCLDGLNVLIYWSRLISSLWSRCAKDVDGKYNLYGNVVYNFLFKDLHKLMAMILPEGNFTSLTNLPVSIEIFLYLNKLSGSIPENNFDIRLLLCPDQELLSQFDNEIKEALNNQTFELTWFQISESQDVHTSLTQTLHLLRDRRIKSLFLQKYFIKYGIINIPIKTSNTTILHRMEIDRERHKKSKEHLWFIERDQHMLESVEFDLLWNSDDRCMTRDDYQNMRALQAIAKESYVYS